LRELQKDTLRQSRVPEVSAAVGLVCDFVYFIVPLVAGLPIFWRWLIWFTSFSVFIFCMQILVPYFYRRISSNQRVMNTLALTCLFVLGFWSIAHAQWRQEKAIATSGDLAAKSDGKDHSSEPPKLRIGPNGGVTIAWTGTQGSPMFNAYMDKIKLVRLNGKILLSTTVRDDNGNLIADIHDNHWKVYYISSDHNYTDDSLEVQDAKGRVVLQVKVLPDVVELQEEWGGRALTGPSGVTIPAGGLFQAGKQSDKEGIVPLFKYPSDLYWGEYVVPSNY
jgi:hypothetical protein